MRKTATFLDLKDGEIRTYEYEEEDRELPEPRDLLKEFDQLRALLRARGVI